MKHRAVVDGPRSGQAGSGGTRAQTVQGHAISPLIEAFVHQHGGLRSGGREKEPCHAQRTAANKEWCLFFHSLNMVIVN